MASSSKYNLKWNSHHVETFNSFDTLRSRETLVDVTLSCEGQSLKAHKLVLCAGSGYFERVLQRDSNHNPVIYFFGVDAHLLKFLVDFMYVGEVDIPSVDLERFIQLAEALEVKGLKGDRSKTSSYNTSALASAATTIPVSDVQDALAHKRKATAWQSYDDEPQYAKTPRRSLHTTPSLISQGNGPSPRVIPRSASGSVSSASSSTSGPSASTKEEPVIKDEVVDIAEEEPDEGEEQEQLDEQEEWDEESHASYYAEAEGEGAPPNNQDMPQNIPPEINPSVS
ncbi:unnamed protein product [Darwinula stevensoni]|uniref:BTB domain-containing protein n=1 Tax=Darwinula stevensoni TaxID=69355 RepID=A0A7R9AHQ1_9CRUS|nr:unnamed protein product [Darwinula stevensoni]CAG0905003.1 unnamed protein product [Darwinula stevensoni]